MWSISCQETSKISGSQILPVNSTMKRFDYERRNYEDPRTWRKKPSTWEAKFIYSVLYAISYCSCLSSCLPWFHLSFGIFIIFGVMYCLAWLYLDSMIRKKRARSWKIVGIRNDEEMSEVILDLTLDGSGFILFNVYGSGAHIFSVSSKCSFS